MDSFLSLYKDEDLNETISSLYRSIYDSSVSIDQLKLRRAIWLASILACSEDSSHKNLAQLLAGLLYTRYSDNPQLAAIAYVLYSRSGNLIATKHLKSLYGDDDKFRTYFGSNIDFEVIDKIAENSVLIEEKDTLFSDFQKELWQTLLSHDYLSISAPTSAGKSFIVQNFIAKQIKENKKLQVMYIVPTKALLNQVAEDFREIDAKLNVRTSYLENSDDFDNDEVNIYLLTPERCIKLLNQTSFKPSIIFIDEIQNTEDLNGRGVVFEYVSNEISDKWPDSKVITAGPHILQGKDLFKELFYKEAQETVTITNPTFQLKTKVEYDIHSNEIEIALWDEINSRFFPDKRKVIPTDNLAHQLNRISSTVGAKVSAFSYALGKGEQNLIYCARRDNAERFALELAALVDEDYSPDQDVKDLIEYLRNEIHEKYSLITCLYKGVAYHHSTLPDVARKEIEVLFKSKDKSIQFLFCTSTLMQGVNLPAKNLFIHSPKKQSQPLTKFEFGNLKGRAGRINESLYGTIYGLKMHKDEDDEESSDWQEEYYSSEPSKEIETANSTNLKNPSFLIDQLTSLIENNIITGENKQAYRTIIYLKGKFIKNRTELRNYLEGKIADPEVINQIESLIEESLKDIEVSYNVVKQNPNIDPVLLDRLYKSVKEDPTWNFFENNNFKSRLNLEKIKPLTYENKPYYWQFADICYRLDQIFNITNETYFQFQSDKSISYLAHRAFEWMEGDTLNSLIKSNINYWCGEKVSVEKRLNKESSEDINKIIKETIEFNNNEISFVLAKYFKALSDVLADILSEDEKAKRHRIISMHTYLELGSYKPNVILLISSGLSRSLAIMIDDEYEKMNGADDGIPNILHWLKLKGKQMSLRSVFMKYLDKQGFFTL